MDPRVINTCKIICGIEEYDRRMVKGGYETKSGLLFKKKHSKYQWIDERPSLEESRSISGTPIERR